MYKQQAGHDQAAKLSRACGAAFSVPKQFVEDLVGFGSNVGDGGGGDGGGGGGGEGGGGGGGGRGRGGDVSIPPELRLIGREELDFGGKVMQGGAGDAFMS